MAAISVLALPLLCLAGRYDKVSGTAQAPMCFYNFMGPPHTGKTYAAIIAYEVLGIKTLGNAVRLFEL